MQPVTNANQNAPISLVSSKLCEGMVAGFAGWTIISNMTALTGKSLQDLLISFAGLCFLIGIWGWKKHHTRFGLTTSSTSECISSPQHVQVVLFWVLAVMAVILTLVAHRPDEDDNRYINWAIAVTDDPHLPILEYDTLHSPPNRPIFPPPTKVMSREMLIAALTWLTHIPPIYLDHLVFAPLAALFLILAYGELFKQLAPRQWAYGILAVVVFLIANGEIHYSYGNFSFVRLHQGKGVLVSVIVPLILTYGLRFAAQPTKRNWLLLSAAQICGIGMTSTALMVAPTVAQLAVLSGLPKMPLRQQITRLVWGFTTSGYVVAIGVYIKLRYMWQMNPLGASSELFDQSVELTMGTGRFAILCLFILLTAWLWCDSRAARRLCLIFPLVVMSVFANPLTTRIWAKYVTHASFYWRVFWLLPLPAIAGLALLAPLSAKFARFPLKWRYAGYGLLLLLVLWPISEQNIFAPNNRVTLKLPGLKVPPVYQVAQVINDLFNDRPNVLVPADTVGAWLPTFAQHPYPLVSRFIHTNSLGDERRERIQLTLYIMGINRPDNAPAFLRNGLQKYHVEAVCFLLSNPWKDEIQDVLEEAGFELRVEMLSYAICFRPSL